jgi:glycosyltransferase involved in cell wall biosynthesis
MASRILCISTAGSGQDPLRVRRLTDAFADACHYVNLDRSLSRLDNARNVWQLLREEAWDLVYLEGTGIAGGLPLIAAAKRWGQPYVVSSGDPVGGYFKTVKGPVAGAVFGAYEKQLYRNCAGFIGWTPYLTGVALSLGAPRAVTVEGAVDPATFRPYTPTDRRRCKEHYGLDPDHLVCGVVGSLTWNERQQYSYGLELVEMLRRTTRTDVSLLVVGDGTGLAELQRRVPSRLAGRVAFTGRVPESEVVDTLNAMDVGFITQTLDDLGPYRLTTKLPEYLAAGLPVAMSPIPGLYDYALPAGWALPAAHPASPAFWAACADWVDALTWPAVNRRRKEARAIADARFAYSVVRPRFESFVDAILTAHGGSPLSARFPQPVRSSVARPLSPSAAAS